MIVYLSFQLTSNTEKINLLTATKCFKENRINTILVVPWLMRGKKVAYYNDIVKNITSRIRGWHSINFYHVIVEQSLSDMSS